MNTRISLSLAFGLSTGLLAAQECLTTTRIARFIRFPVDLNAPPGDTARLFVVERGGRIKIINNGSVLSAPFLDIGSMVNQNGEGGMLGLAFHPNYASNGRFFVYFNRQPDSASMVVEYTVSSGNPNVADPASAQTLLGPVTQPFANHNGGCIRFAPDGYLYVGLGDGGGAGDPMCNAQDPSTLLGKMLRLDVDTPGSRVPATNPFVGNPAFQPEIWSLGLRNPWRFSFDRSTGDLWIGDVGQSTREEISFQPASSSGAENYGWKVMEGTTCQSSAACAVSVPACQNSAFTPPVHEYSQAGGASLTGGYVYRGTAMPSLQGTYFFTDFTSHRMRTFRRSSSGGVVDLRDRTPVMGELRNVSAFGEGGDGELYALAYYLGEVHRIESRPSPAQDLGRGKVGSSGVEPYFTVCGGLGAGQTAEFALTSAPAAASAAMIVGLTNNPRPLLTFGTIVPDSIAFSVPFFTDANGEARFTAPGGGGAVTAYVQWFMIDAGASGSIGISNALSVQFQ